MGFVTVMVSTSFGLEVEQPHHGDDLALEVRIVQLARDHAAHGDVAGRGDRELQHQLALQLGVVALRARVEA